MTTSTESTFVRSAEARDYGDWRAMWDAYNAFYERTGPTALPEDVTQLTWRRFFDATEPVFALVAEREGLLLGFTHFLFHRTTWRAEHECYLEDLFTLPSERGRGVARALIDGVCSRAASAGSRNVYWQTHESNSAGRLLYDRIAKHSGFIIYSRSLQ